MNLALKGGLELCGWRLPKGKGCGRAWVSRGLIRRKLSEKVLPPTPPPQLTVSYSFTLNVLDSLQGASVLQGLITSREVLQLELGLHFHPKESYGLSDQLRRERTFALTACSLILRSLGSPWLCIPIRTQFEVWSWMFAGLFAFSQTYSGTDHYISWSFLTPFFQEGQEYWVMNPGPVELAWG